MPADRQGDLQASLAALRVAVRDAQACQARLHQRLEALERDRILDVEAMRLAGEAAEAMDRVEAAERSLFDPVDGSGS